MRAGLYVRLQKAPWVASRARDAFDIEKVTREFYRDFDAQRKAFLKHIEGIGVLADREWYASVMLNRLMFVYFIQNKGFLDNDPDYLSHRLQKCQKEQGKDKFYTFYRYFLLRLFSEGFGKQRKDRTPELEELLGNIPYLNGGLFDVHELEQPDKYGKDIQIPDKAFERIFAFFEGWEWELDPHRTVKKPGDKEEINPDVLGYIFEKYINQKQMGAYYTKEDITEHISKNTILPFLFESARPNCKIAFENYQGPTIWDLIKENPDRYIYEPLKRGKDLALPKEIEIGVKDSSRRHNWNKTAPDDYGLPTETWGEVVERRERYSTLIKTIASGRIACFGDITSLNLDGRQFTASCPLWTRCRGCGNFSVSPEKTVLRLRFAESIGRVKRQVRGFLLASYSPQRSSRVIYGGTRRFVLIWGSKVVFALRRALNKILELSISGGF